MSEASRAPEATIVAVVLGFLALGGAYLVAGPPFESPDEISHAEYATFISDYRRFPILQQDCVRLSFHPPLYHALLAPLARFMDISTEDVLAGHTRNPEFPESPIALVHGYPEETFPYAGAVRFVKLARLLTLFMALPVLVYTHRIARLVLGDGPAATLAVAAVASVPQFQYLAASVNHDALAAACGAAVLYYSMRLAQAPAVAPALGAGIALGLGLLTKSSLITLLPVPFVALVCRARTHSPRTLLAHAALVLSVCVGLAGWWYARNLVHYGHLLPTVPLHQTTWVGDRIVRTAPMDLASLMAALAQIFQSFWFLAGLMNVPAAIWMYVAWAGVSLVALAGSVRMLRRPDSAALALGFWLSLAGVIQYCWYVYSSQGRYLFLALPVVGVALASAIGFLPAPWRTRAAHGTALVVAAVSVVCFWRSFAPAYAGIAPHARAPVAETAQLYCRNEYSQSMHARGGELRGLRLGGRRLGEGSYEVALRLTAGERTREVSLPSSALSERTETVDVEIPPIRLQPGEEYEVSLSAPDATPIARPTFLYRRAAGAGGLSLNGIALAGALEVAEIVR